MAVLPVQVALAASATPLSANELAPVPTLAPMLEGVMPAVVNIATQGHVERPKPA